MELETYGLQWLLSLRHTIENHLESISIKIDCPDRNPGQCLWYFLPWQSGPESRASRTAEYNCARAKSRRMKARFWPPLETESASLSWRKSVNYREVGTSCWTKTVSRSRLQRYRSTKRSPQAWASWLLQNQQKRKQHSDLSRLNHYISQNSVELMLQALWKSVAKIYTNLFAVCQRSVEFDVQLSCRIKAAMMDKTATTIPQHLPEYH